VKNKNNLYVALILVALSFIFYYNTIGHDYALDDSIVIKQNRYTMQGFRGIKGILKHDTFMGFFKQKKDLVSGGRYRPFSLITFAVEWELFASGYMLQEDKLDGDSYDRMQDDRVPASIIQQLTAISNQKYVQRDSFIQAVEKQIGVQPAKKYRERILEASIKPYGNPHISHFINIILNAWLGILIFILVGLLMPVQQGRPWYLTVPFIAAVLFVIHPVHTEVIANIKGRDEILALAGSLLTFIYIWRYLGNKKKVFLWYASVAFFLGLMSKENTAMFLFVIPLAVYFFRDKNKKQFVFLIPLTLALVLFLFIRQDILGKFSSKPPTELMNNPFLHAEGNKLSTIIYTLGYYVRLLIWPYPLTYDYYPYHIKIMPWENKYVLLSLAGYLTLGIYAVRGFFRRDRYAFWILYYMITLSVVSNVVFPVGSFMNERFIFMPSVAFAVIVAALLFKELPRIMKDSKKAYVISGGVVLISLVLMIRVTHARNKAWKDDFTLFTTDVKVSKDSAKGNTAAGGTLTEGIADMKDEKMKQERLDEAVKYLKRALDIHPTYADPLNLLGNAYVYKEEYDSALIYYHRVLRLSPRRSMIAGNIKICIQAMDSVDQKINALKKTLAINPRLADFAYSAGSL
jgi:hypothetical protein